MEDSLPPGSESLQQIPERGLEFSMYYQVEGHAAVESERPHQLCQVAAQGSEGELVARGMRAELEPVVRVPWDLPAIGPDLDKGDTADVLQSYPTTTASAARASSKEHTVATTTAWKTISTRTTGFLGRNIMVLWSREGPQGSQWTGTVLGFRLWKKCTRPLLILLPNACWRKGKAGGVEVQQQLPGGFVGGAISTP